MTKGKKRLLIGAAAAILIYSLDDLSARFGISSRPQYSTVTIRRYYFINEKYNKFSYEPAPSIEERCVNALFPHPGARPCWYVRRHTLQTIEVN